jgi:hypothetical protein
VGDVRATGPLLWLRASLLGSIALLTGVVSHAAADGLLPSVRWLVLLGVAATVASAWVLRRRVSGLALVALAVIGQAGAHLALSVLAGHRGQARAVVPRPVVGDGSLEDALMGGYADAPVQPSLGWSMHLVDHVIAVGPLMVLAHLLGAVALAGWLALGEAALWALLLFVGAEIRSWFFRWPTTVATRRARAARVVVPPAALRRWLLAHAAVTRRGPPAPVC